jgi:hypothetical protein
MKDDRVLRVLFPTSFSGACVKTGHAIAQMASRRVLELTIVHVAREGSRNRGAVAQLESFLPHADRHSSCIRRVIEGEEPAAAVAEVCRSADFDLVMAPASDCFTLKSLLTPSFRARLLRRRNVALWTASACVPPETFARPIRTIACLVDFYDQPERLLQQASSFATSLGARLRVLCSVPPVDDGMLAEVLNTQAPLTPSMAHSRIQAMWMEQVGPVIDIVAGDRGDELRTMLRTGMVDLLIVGQGHALSRAGTFLFSRVLDQMPCPVVCLERASPRAAGWSRRRPLLSLIRDRVLTPVVT